MPAITTSPGRIGEPRADAGDGSQEESPIVDLTRFVPRGPWPTGFHIALAALVFAAHLYFADDYYGPITRACTGAEGAILVLLVTRYARRKPPRLPWVEFIYAVYYILFGLGVLESPNPVGIADVIPRADSFDFAAILALAGSLCLIAGFALTRHLFRNLRADKLFPPMDPETLVRGGRIHLPIAAAYVLLTALVPSTRVPLLPIANIGAALIFYTPMLFVAALGFLARPARPTGFRLLAALAVIGVAVGATSMLNDAVVPLAGLVFLWWCARDRLPLLPMIVAASVLFVLQPVKSYYRAIQWKDQSASILDSWQEAFTEAHADDHSSIARAATGRKATIHRLSELTGVAYAVEVVPSAIPHTGGIVYPLLLPFVVPRFLWPDKPDTTKAGLDPFTIALDLTTEEGAQNSTTNVTLLAQGYLEHGIPGSLSWMLLLGGALGLASRYFGTRLAGTLAGLCFLVPWSLATGSSFLSCFGGLFQTTVGSTLLAWLVWLLGGGLRRTGRAGAPERTPRGVRGDPSIPTA